MAKGPAETLLAAQAHALDGAEVLARLKTSSDGLTTAEAARRLAQLGPNVLVPEKGDSLASELVESLLEPLQLLLLAVGVLSFLWGEVSDGIAIVAVIASVIVLEALVEARTGRAVAALHSLVAPRARILRDGRSIVIDATDAVPGDIVVLEAGDIIPADCRVIAAVGLLVDESMLSGEPVPASKGPTSVLSGVALAERSSMVFAGTAVVGGEGRAAVVATGATTEAGRLGALVATQREPRTPLQKAMAELARVALVAALAVSVAVPAMGVLRGRPVHEMVLAGLTLAFATVPEELPILVTVLLAVGGRRLAARGALVRRLHAAETLGSVTIVVTDKTGTLTENRLRLAVVDGDEDRVTLVGVAASGGEAGDDPVERALAVAARARGVWPTGRPVARFAFDPDRKAMSVAWQDGTEVLVAAKGAPESILGFCTLAPGDRATILGRVEALAARGLRVLAVASRRAEHVPTSPEHAETELDFVGLVGFEDPLRPGVSEAVAALTAGGVRTLMVTGDHAATAKALAVQLGLGDDVAIGPELSVLDDEALAKRLVSLAAVARATPADKLRIVRALQAGGEVVAVTGDGVNDAPALARADAGIAMGRRGTDLARQAAGIVLTDDAYPTVLVAIEGGRGIRSQLRRAVAFYLGAKLALITVMAVPLALGHAAPFAPVHIVVLELFMDLGASIAFVSEPPTPSATTRGPTGGGRFLNQTELGAIGAVAVSLAVGVILSYLLALARLGPGAARTVAVVAWLASHVAVAWFLRVRPSLRLGANPAFPVWALIAWLVALAASRSPLGDGIDLVRLGTDGFVLSGIGIGVAVGVVAAGRRLLILAQL